MIRNMDWKDKGMAFVLFVVFVAAMKGGMELQEISRYIYFGSVATVVVLTMGFLIGYKRYLGKRIH